MDTQTCHSLLLERIALRFGAGMRKYRVPAIAGMVFGMLAYLFFFTNKLVNHDEVQCLFDKGATFSSGRWGLRILEFIFPNYSMPWLYGIITIVLITLSVCLMVSIFSIRTPSLQVLLAGTVMVFPSLIGLLAYMFTSSSYAAAFLLAVLAVWFVTRPDIRAMLPGLFCMVASLSIYQSYVALAAGLLVLFVIRQLLTQEDVAAAVKSGVVYVLFLVISLGIYYVGTMVINRLLGVGLSAYAGSGMSFRFSELPQRTVLAYQSFLQFFSGYRGLLPTALSQGLHILLFVLMGLMMLLLCRKLPLPRVLLIAVLVVILPLAVNCMYLFSDVDSVHTLVLYGFVAFYVLAVLLADLCISKVPSSRQVLPNALSFALALIVAGNIFLANRTGLLLHLRYENAYSFYTSLVADIKMTPGFDENTKLAVIGYYREPDFYLEQFPFSDHITGTDGFLPDIYSKDRFLEYYLGFPIPMASEAEIAEIAASEEYAAMARYPYYGSMQKIGDILVVKLS